mmetsp:Transcript_18449/g.36476  ORF Transcript_18449/g.36476 Transcript_18449/m.36476 type:complete len:216 (-) Transcript_18449:51-698(-)
MKPSFSSRNFQSSTSSSWWHSISITEPGRYVFWASCTLLRSRVMPSNTVAYSYPRPRLPTVFSNSTNTLVALLLLLLLLLAVLAAAGGGAAAADVDDNEGSPPFWWFWFRFWFLPRATAARVCAVTSGKPPPCTPATAAATSASASASAPASASAAAAALLALFAAPLAAAAAALGSLAKNLSVELAPKSSNTTRTWAAFSRSLVGAPARLTLAP